MAALLVSSALIVNTQCIMLQDVCLSIWTEDHSHDLMWKVTDVCDPKDCPTPLDIKVEPYKVCAVAAERHGKDSCTTTQQIHMAYVMPAAQPEE
jgi:hypothetical protein